MGRESNFSAVAPSLEGRQLSNVDSSYGDLSGGFGSLGNNRIGLRGPSASSKSYCSTNQSTEGKEDEKIKGKSLPICRCISNDLHANNVPQNSKGNLGLSQG